MIHRGVNRKPNIPRNLEFFFRRTSKQEWSEIAVDLVRQHVGVSVGMDSVTDAEILEELSARRSSVARQRRAPK